MCPLLHAFLYDSYRLAHLTSHKNPVIGMATLISDQLDFNKNVTRVKLFIMIQRSLHQKVTSMSMYAPNNRATK